MSDDQIDDLYAEIADDIDRQVKEETHELGEPFHYKEILLGKSDYNEFHNLYIFDRS